MTIPFEELAFLFIDSGSTARLSVVEAAELRRQAQIACGTFVEFDLMSGDTTALLASVQGKRKSLSAGPNPLSDESIDDFLNGWSLRSRLQLQSGDLTVAPAETVGFVLMHAGESYRESLRCLLRIWTELSQDSGPMPIVCVIVPDDPDSADEIPASTAWKTLASRLVSYGIAEFEKSENQSRFRQKCQHSPTAIHLHARREQPPIRQRTSEQTHIANL